MMIVQIAAEQADLTVTVRCGGSYQPSVMRELRDHAVGTFRDVWANLPENDGEPVLIEETLDVEAPQDDGPQPR